MLKETLKQMRESNEYQKFVTNLSIVNKIQDADISDLLKQRYEFHCVLTTECLNIVHKRLREVYGDYMLSYLTTSRRTSLQEKLIQARLLARDFLKESKDILPELYILLESSGRLGKLVNEAWK